MVMLDLADGDFMLSDNNRPHAEVNGVCNPYLLDKKTRAGKGDCGSALIMVLVAILTIGMLVLVLTRSMNNSIDTMTVVKNEAVTYQLARTALEMAKIELSRKKLYCYSKYDNRVYFLPSNFETDSLLEEAEFLRDGRVLGMGMYAYRIISSWQRLDYNRLTPEQWHRLFEVALRMDEGPDRSALVDRILDWIDKDDLTRENGAEADFYEELSPPRAIRNGPLESLDELGYIDQITPEMMDGSDLYPLEEEDGMYYGGGLRWYFTHSPDELTRNSLRYIMTGDTEFLEDFEAEDEDEEEEYVAQKKLPARIFVIAEGYIPAVLPDIEEFEKNCAAAREKELYNYRPDVIARHIILCTLRLRGNKYQLESYRDDVDEDELLDIIGVESRLSRYVPGEKIETSAESGDD